MTGDTNFYLLWMQMSCLKILNSDISKSKWNALGTETKGDIINSDWKKYELALEMGQKAISGVGVLSSI